MNKDIVPQVARSCNVNTNDKKPTGKTRNRYKPRVTDFDQKLCLEVQDWDVRGLTTIARHLGYKSKTPVIRSLRRLEAIGKLVLEPFPNGKRKNNRYRILKFGSENLKAIDLFNSPHYKDWNRKTRMQLIDRYMRIGWNVVPLRKDLQPIMDQADWLTLSPKEKLKLFGDHVFGVGMWIDKHIIFNFRKSRFSFHDAPPAFETLTAKTPDGYQCYFWDTPQMDRIYSVDRVVHNVDIITRRKFIVLPPTRGYEWIMPVAPSHLYYFRELLEMWDHYALRWRQRVSDSAYVGFVFPDCLLTEAHLFRFGRSLRACYATFQEIEYELGLLNQQKVRPRLSDDQLHALVKRVWELPNKPDFVTAKERNEVIKSDDAADSDAINDRIERLLNDPHAVSIALKGSLIDRLARSKTQLDKSENTNT